MLFTRPDAERCTDVPAARRMMPFLIQSRTEAQVYFEQTLDLTRAQPFVERWNQRHPELKISIFHLYLHALARTLPRWPRLNRFVSGGVHWQRRGVYLTFAAKKRMTQGAPLVPLKRRVDDLPDFEALVRAVHGDVKDGRGERPSTLDREMSVLLALPALVLGWAVRLTRWLDAFNLLPHAFLRTDPLYTSLFVANLGSLGLEPAFHHLFEFGNCPLFATLGKSELTWSPQGPRLTCTVRYTFDERVEDGMYCAAALAEVKALLEDPQALTGLTLDESPAQAA